MGAPQSFRQRYIAFRVPSSAPRGKLEEMVSVLGRKTDHFYDPWLVFYDEDLGEGLIKCEHEQLREIKRMMESMEELDIQMLGVSGTIKKARQKFLGGANRGP